MKKKLTAFFLMFVATALFAAGPVFFKIAVNTGLPPGNTIFYFFVVAALFGLITLKKMPVHKLAKSETAKVIVAGITWAMMIVLYVSAFQIRTITETALLVGFAPIFSVILTITLLKEKVRSPLLLISALLIGAISVLLFIGEGSSITTGTISTTFLVLGILTAISAAIARIVRESLRRDGVPMPIIMTYVTAVAALVTVVYSGFTDKILMVPNVTQSLLILLMGIGTVWVPGILTLKAAKIAGSLSKLNILEYSTPILTALIAFVLVGERGFGYITLSASFMGIAIAAILINRAIRSKT